jgi:hypothetical protein
MERASQRFTLQARIITVTLSLAIVFAAHLDAVRLFQSMSSDAQVRAQLAGSAEALIKQAEQLPHAKESSRTLVPDVYRTAMVAVLEIPSAPTEQVKMKQARSRSSAKEREKPVAIPGEDRAIIEAKLTAMKALEARPGFASREDADLWLRETLEGDPAVENLAAAYEREVNSELPADTDKLIDHSASIKRDLARSEFRWFPETWPGWHYTEHELPGLLIAAVFLSLCAPLSYNFLKSIASLRPLPNLK